ncbi:MAG: Kelch motif protein [Betaproteobacteria bacterium ADurb.Bin341]|nr:MAG: Kelch motif protein [Betaproteobacteria bacterium ADurb.Bin341]
MLMACLVEAPALHAQSRFPQVADPLPVGAQEMIFLFDGGSQLFVERRHWASGKVLSFRLPGPLRNRKGKLPAHTLAVNATGIWVVGATVTLVRPDGKLAQIDLPSSTAERAMNSYEGGEQDLAIGLNDGALLLLRKVRGETRGYSFRVSWKGGDSLVVQPVASMPAFNYGISATTLTDGRVMVVGGYTSQAQAWLFDPRRDVWEATGNMRIGRMYAGIAATPDGGAFVAGSGWVAASSDSNEVRTGVSHGAEIWNPRTGQWSELPPLPLSYRINAHYANGPSASVLPDGSLVVAGGMHPHVLLLRASNGRFAAHWNLVASLPGQRIGGIVQGLGNQEVVVSRGVQPTSSGGCCRLTEGSDRLTWAGDGEQRTISVGLAKQDAATAQIAEKTFVAGGWEYFYLSFGLTQASALAELIDRRTGAVQALPPLPYPMFSGRAAWLDEHRVVVKAVAHRARYEQSFRGMDGRSLEFDSLGYLAVLDLKREAWTTLEDARIAKAELAGVLNGEAVLIDADGPVFLADAEKKSIRGLPQTNFARRNGKYRVLADGRIIAAGGEAQSEAIQAVDADCEEAKCPVRLFGTGPLTLARRYETLHQGKWTVSAASRGGSSSAVILPDSRVMTLGWIESKAKFKPTELVTGRWLLEESNQAGSKWQSLPWPEGLPDRENRENESCGSSVQERKCQLVLVEHPALPVGAVFLLRSQPGSPVNDIWRWVEESRQWKLIARQARLVNDVLLNSDRIPLMSVGDKMLYGADMLSNHARFWLE